MKISKLSFSQISENMGKAFRRFPFTIIAILTFAGFLLVQIHSGQNDYVDERVWVFLPLAIFGSLSFYLFAENRLSCLLKNLLNGSIILLTAWYAFRLSSPIVQAEIIRTITIGLSFGVAVFFAPFISNKNQTKFWNYFLKTFVRLLIALIFAGVFMAGLSLAFFSLDKLFGANIPDRFYGYLAVLCFVVFFPLYFLSSISDENAQSENADFEFPRLLKILGLYILLPILSIYGLILYGYLIKIIVAWQLPNGWVSWLVSILGIAGFLTMFILHPLKLKNEDKIVRFFFRYFPVILVPLLVLMFVGILRRFSDYGITINRLLVLLLNLWMFGTCIYLFITKSNRLKGIFVSFSVVAFLSAIGPWSVFSITKHSLKGELNQLLTEMNWSTTQKNDVSKLKTKNLNEKDQGRLYNVIDYLSKNYGEKAVRPFYSSTLGENATKNDFLNALNINVLKNQETFSFHSQEKANLISLRDYNQLIRIVNLTNKSKVEINDTLSVELNGSSLILTNTAKQQKLNISMENVIRKSLENEERSPISKDYVIQGSNYELLIQHLSGEKNDNLWEINNLNALLLLN